MEAPDGGGSPTDSPTVEVKFSLTDAAYPFTGAALDAATTYELTDIVPRDDGCCAEFFDVTGGQPERIVEAVSAFDGVEAMLLTEYDDGGRFEFLVSGDCPIFDLAERGAVPHTVRGADGRGTIVADIPTHQESRAVIESFLARYPEAEMAAKRRKDAVTPRYSRTAYERIQAEALTDRQWEVLETAFDCGYYEWPRECTGEKVAGELGITSATFSEHVHAAERKLLSLVLSEGAAESHQQDRP